MLVATWNINGIRARSVRLAEWLAERKPDVVCLQELKIPTEDFPHLELRSAGYYAAVVGQPSWNGVAILAREQPELIQKELAPMADAGSRFVVAKAAGIEVASVYVPNGKTIDHTDFGMKIRWLSSLADYLENRADKSAPLLVGGDFNVCPTALDSHGGASFDGHIFHTKEEREQLSRLAGAGLVDLFRAKYPDVPGFSWWDYRAGCFHKNHGLRIDLLFGTAPLASRVKDVYVDREYRKKSKDGAAPSDHAPVIAELI